MGHGGLYRYILRHPEEFKALKFDSAVGKEKKNGRAAVFNLGIREQHLKTARRLTTKHGMMPSVEWLASHGYTKLVSYIKTYPKLFVRFYKPKRKAV